MLKIGEKAPEFSFSNDEKELRLSDFKGKKVILYFYPKDNTPGCTTEACAFRDAYDELTDAGAIIIGVSPDSERSHNKFKEKHNLQFFLINDEDKKTIETYGAWGEKNMCGKKYMGVIRSTYIIDKNGNISHVFPKVSPKKHIAEIMQALTEK